MFNTSCDVRNIVYYKDLHFSFSKESVNVIVVTAHLANMIIVIQSGYVQPLQYLIQSEYVLRLQ